MTPGPTSTAGQTLRKLRRQRGLTLQQVSRSVGISVPVLSRKERGQQALERSDIRAIIEGFRLSPAEAYELWTRAGFVPETVLAPPRGASAPPRTFAETYLPHIAFPACVLTFFGSYLAWNQEYESVWQLSRLSVRPPHLLDMLFLTPVPTELGDAWERFTWQIMYLLYQRTPRLIYEPRFLKLLDRLSQHYGNAFESRWHALQQSRGMPPDGPPATPILVPRQSPYGVITYLLLHSTVLLAQDHELLVLVPFGTESHAHYQQMCHLIPASRIYF